MAVERQPLFMSEWQRLYLQYESLESRWPVAHRALLRDMLRLGFPDQLENVTGLPEPDLMAEAMSLRPAIAEALRPSEMPYEDVYQAAIQMTADHRHWTHPDCYYRGQRRRQWADHVEPAIFRRNNPNEHLSDTELQDRLA